MIKKTRELYYKLECGFATGGRKYYYFVYTFIFVILSFFVFSWFIFTDTSFIWEIDGWHQHFKALVYYSKFLKEIFRHLIVDHKIIIPEWDFHIGEGADIINALHFYVIGDPICLLSAFVPTRYMQYFFSGACAFRLYLAGIAFSELCFETGDHNKFAILGGAVSYDFCFWGLYGVVRHPYFLNPMIYFPLMILGIEKIIKRKRPYLFIFITAISAVSNFYFFYMISILSAIYTIIRLIIVFYNNKRKDLRPVVIYGISSYFLGVCLAGIVFLPVFSYFLSDSRASIKIPFQWFYPFEYYSELPAVFLTNEHPYWLCIGFTPIVLVAVFLLFQEKKSLLTLKVLFICSMIITITPFFGRGLNGFSYVTNRWSWAFALLGSFILTIEWDHLQNLEWGIWRRLFIWCIFYYLVCILADKSRETAVFSAIPIMFIVIILSKPILLKKDATSKYYLLIIMAGIINIAFWEYSPAGGNYVSECINNNDVWNKWDNNETMLVSSVAEDEYPRYTGSYVTENVNLVSGISNTQYYWTISNPYMNDYRTELSMRESSLYNYNGYDSRTTPIELSSIRYFISQGGITPFGFSYLETMDLIDQKEERINSLKKELNIAQLSDKQMEKVEEKGTNTYDIYMNQYPLSLGYCYDKCISDDLWETLNSVQKQEIGLEAAYVEQIPEGVSLYEDELSDYIIPYEIEYNSNEISQHDSQIITTEKDQSIVLHLKQDTANSEVYVGVEGLDYNYTYEYDLYFGDTRVDPYDLYNRTDFYSFLPDKKSDIYKEKLYQDLELTTDLNIEASNGIQSAISYSRPEAKASSGRHDYIANIGYVDDPIESITVNFSKRGVYNLDRIRVYSIPKDDYQKKVERLQNNMLQNIGIDTDCITGNIDVADRKILCIAIPYDKGWDATIDGESVDVYCVNRRYLGLTIPAGSHVLKMVYNRPLQREGMLLSIFGILGSIILGIIVEKERIKARYEDHK